MNSNQNHTKNLARPLSLEEWKELKSMSRKLRQLKRQMFLKQVEAAPTPVDTFRSLIMGLAVEQEAKEALWSRSDSFSSQRTLSRFSSFNDSSMRDLQDIEE
jgi:hypothetical protein